VLSTGLRKPEIVILRKAQMEEEASSHSAQNDGSRLGVMGDSQIRL